MINEGSGLTLGGALKKKKKRDKDQKTANTKLVYVGETRKGCVKPKTVGKQAVYV